MLAWLNSNPIRTFVFLDGARVPVCKRGLGSNTATTTALLPLQLKLIKKTAPVDNARLASERICGSACAGHAEDRNHRWRCFKTQIEEMGKRQEERRKENCSGGFVAKILIKAGGRIKTEVGFMFYIFTRSIEKYW